MTYKKRWKDCRRIELENKGVLVSRAKVRSLAATCVLFLYFFPTGNNTFVLSKLTAENSVTLLKGIHTGKETEAVRRSNTSFRLRKQRQTDQIGPKMFVVNSL